MALTLDALTIHDWLAFGMTAYVAATVLAVSLLAGRSGRFERSTTRKAMHIGMGGLYVLHWPLYSNTTEARLLCATVPLLATAAFLVIGLGLLPLKVLVDSATRGGRRQELLTGPLIYGLVHALLTVVFFTSSPAGVLSVAVLCWGDGAAELVGRRATSRLPHNKGKTWAGTLAFLAASLVASCAYALYFRAMGPFERPVPLAALLAGCALCSGVGAAVESLPLEGDNLWVPLATVAASVWFFGF